MAKAKIDKETRKLIEGLSDLVKKKGDSYKFKSKNKKMVKRVKKSCPHWIMRKGKLVPAVRRDQDDPSYWRCEICGAKFPVAPMEDADSPTGYYEKISEDFLEIVNQVEFWSVRMGGDADDMKMFIKLRELVPQFSKASKQIIKRVMKREAMESGSEKKDSMSQFDVYSGFNYR